MNYSHNANSSETLFGGQHDYVTTVSRRNSTFYTAALSVQRRGLTCCRCSIYANQQTHQCFTATAMSLYNTSHTSFSHIATLDHFNYSNIGAINSAEIFFRKLLDLSNCIRHLLSPPRDTEITSRLIGVARGCRCTVAGRRKKFLAIFVGMRRKWG